MKLGNTWYCITKACSQPAYGEGCGIASAGQRAAASHAAHHSIASSRLLAPMKNISRCGALASNRGDIASFIVSAATAATAFRRQAHELACPGVDARLPQAG